MDSLRVRSELIPTAWSWNQLSRALLIESLIPTALDRSNVFSSRALGAHAFLVLYRLAFAKRFKAFAFDGRVMKEVLTVVARDESKTFVRYELFDYALRHS